MTDWRVPHSDWNPEDSIEERYAFRLRRAFIDVVAELGVKKIDMVQKQKLQQKYDHHAIDMGRLLFHGVYVLTGVRDE